MSFLPSTGFTRVGAYSIQICQLISNCLFVFKIVSANRVACSFIGVFCAYEALLFVQSG